MLLIRGCIFKSRSGQPAAGEQHAALSPVSCGSCTHIDMCASYICLLHLNSVRYFRVRGRYGVMVICHINLMALCGITVQNAALSLSLVGHPCSKESIDKFLDSPCLFPSFHAFAHTYASTLDVLTL